MSEYHVETPIGLPDPRRNPQRELHLLLEYYLIQTAHV